ncbi:MAG: heme exporter protein CcmB [Hyphomonadaceae bacterium]
MSAALALFRRDLALAWSAGAGAAAPLGFFLGAAALLPLTIGAERALLAQVGPPILWIAAALAALLVLERLFQADLEEGGLDQLLLSPAPLEALVAAKAAALWLAVGVPIALASIPVSIMLQAPAEAAPVIALSLAIGMAAFIGAGLIGAAAAAGVKRAGVLIALLVLPFFAPPILFGATAALDAAQGTPFGPAFLLLCGCALFALALGPVAAAAALRLQTE